MGSNKTSAHRLPRSEIHPYNNSDFELITVDSEWINRKDEPCRVMFVMVAAERVVLGDGTVLEETVIKKT